VVTLILARIVDGSVTGIDIGVSSLTISTCCSSSLFKIFNQIIFIDNTFLSRDPLGFAKANHLRFHHGSFTVAYPRPAYHWVRTSITGSISISCSVRVNINIISCNIVIVISGSCSSSWSSLFVYL